MRNKIIKLAICCLAALTLLAALAPADGKVYAQTADEVQGVIDGVVAYKTQKAGVSTVQQWINGSLAQNAGISSEWYVIALSQYGDYDFAAYENSLLDYLSENEEYSASSRQKYALALIAAGSTDSYIYKTLNDSIGRLGVMSWIFGLHLLNNGYSCSEYTVSQVQKNLLSLQLDDGGWANVGTYSDVDTTAMAIQALAPYYKSDTAVNTAVNDALSYLSNRQQAEGDYASYGISCPESTAQVLVALSSLGIDCQTDSRFIKNGNTVLDGIKKYRLSGGGFCHTAGGAFNETATAQVLYSMVSYLRFKNGETGLYILDNRNSAGLEIPGGSEISTSSATASSQNPSQGTPVTDFTTQSDNSIFGNYKFWVCLAIIIIAGGACLALILRKKWTGSNCIVVLAAAAAAVIFVLVTNFQSTEQFYGGTSSVPNSAGTVTLTIRCDTVPDKSAEHIPDDGVILAITELEIQEGDTVYDLLVSACAADKLHLETAGSADSVYVEGIGNIYEFDFGDLSGWLYRVNGEQKSVSCGEYVLTDGDAVEWLYTCEMGQDIK